MFKIIAIIISLLYTYKWGLTALHFAAIEGHNAVVELLLEAGSDIHAKDDVSICITCIYKQIIIQIYITTITDI